MVGSIHTSIHPSPPPSFHLSLPSYLPDSLLPCPCVSLPASLSPSPRPSLPLSPSLASSTWCLGISISHTREGKCVTSWWTPILPHTFPSLPPSLLPAYLSMTPCVPASPASPSLPLYLHLSLPQCPCHLCHQQYLMIVSISEDE